MKSFRLPVYLVNHLALSLFLATAAVAHGDEHEHGADSIFKDDTEYAPTYFAHPEHRGILYAHIIFMTLAWVFVLPLAVMFSISKSRYTLLSQFCFLATNAVGLLVGTIYNAKTPDLYPNNAHHRIGWIANWVISIQILVSLVRQLAGSIGEPRACEEQHSFIPLPSSAREDVYYSAGYRLSNDSGQGSEPNTESLRSNSVSTLGDDERRPLPDLGKEFDDVDLAPSSQEYGTRGKAILMSTKIVSSKVWNYVNLVYRIVDRIVLPLGFIALITGIATFGRFFEGSAIFNGLAHWIKGGIFFWLGLFTLGRWSGSFGEIGWAWNLRLKKKQGRRWIPSSEFVESALIFVYGSTNVFLEHLGYAGKEWRPEDLEHLSITILFLGGGLLGMFVESTKIRELLNTTTMSLGSGQYVDEEERVAFQTPTTYEFSLNPVPALVILLLGIMMGGHHQDTMTSTMVHKQWGNLLLGASFARGLTYVLMYLKPPKSIHPSRPPTELLTSFGLIAGGIIFMASSSDVITGMIHYNVDAMSIYTVTLGLVALLMAYELFILALKGWAVRKERAFA